MTSETDTCIRELEIEVPAEAVEQELARVTQDFARLARIPGFRPGKAPAQLVRTRFDEEIKNEVLQTLIPAHFEAAAREKNLRPIADPHIDKLDFAPGKPLRFRARFEVLPEIELGRYKGLEFERVKLEVTDEDLVQELEALRERAAVLEPVAGRAVEDGDTAVVSLFGLVTQPKEKTSKPIVVEEALCQVGAETTLEAFSQGLRGVQAGEERQIQLTYAGDYPERELAGRTVTYTAKVKAIKRQRLPALDDDFAQQVGEYKTLAELKQKIRENLEAARARREKELTRQRLLDALLALHHFPIPQTLVENQLDARLERRVRVLVAQGLDPQRLDVDWPRLRNAERPAAERDVRLELLLEKIAQAENIEVSAAELEQELARLAQQSGLSAEAVRARLTNQAALDTIKSGVRREKVVELLYAQARLRA